MLSRLQDLLRRATSIIRLSAFDTTDASGRSKERYRRVFLTSMSSAGARGAGILASLITVPLTLHYLGAELYGVWMAMSSVIGMFAFADLGIGNGLLNAVSDAHGRDDLLAVKRYVSSGFYVLLGIAIAIGVVFWVAYPYVPWARIFNVKTPEAVAQTGPAVAVLMMCFVLNLPLGVVSRIRAGFQEGFVDGAFSIFGSVLMLIALLSAIGARGGLPVLAIALVGTPVVALIFNGVELWGRRFPWLRPSINAITRQATERVMRVSVLFFVIQVAGAVAYQSDALILAQILGPAAVTEYAVPMKLFLLIPTFLGFVLVPLWPAYAEALARGDVAWARSTLSRSMKLSLGVSILGGVFLVLAGPTIIRLWVGSAVTPTRPLLLAAASWMILSSIGGTVSVFLNGAHRLKFQTITAVLMMVANVGISIYLTRLIGVSGVLWGSVIAQILVMYIPLAFYMRRVLRRMGTGVA